MNQPAEQLPFEDTQELIVLESTLPVIDFNYEQLKARLEEELEKYEIAVTADTVAGAKKSATELNKLKTQLDTKRKEEIARVSAPIKEADEKLKELVGLCRDSRQKILDQVKVYEAETLKQAEQLLAEHRNELFREHEVKVEFQRAEFDDLILISNVTAKGRLTAGAKSKLESRVRDDKAQQDKVERRLLELENRSYKSGLDAPLSRDHVKPFLTDDDEVYERELQRILDTEVQRQEEAHKAFQARQEREKREQEERERAEAERKARLEQQTQERQPVPIPDDAKPVTPEEPRPSSLPTGANPTPPPPATQQTNPITPDDKDVWDVWPHLVITTDKAKRFPQEVIEKKVREKMEATFSTLEGITVQKR